MDNNKLVSLVQKTNLMKNPKISLLGMGEGNINYLVQEDSKKLVLRTVRLDIPDKRSLYNEHVQLRFLENENINFAPKSLFYDKDTEIHIVSYIPGVDFSIANLHFKYLKSFVRHLIQLENLSIQNFDKYCLKVGIKHNPPEDSAQLFKRVCEDWFKIILDHKADSDTKKIIEWLVPKFNYIQKEMASRKTNIRYKHGDLRWFPGGGNLKLDTKTLYFMDWEGAGFVNDSLLEMGDVVASIPNPKDERRRIKFLIEEYCKLSSKDIGKTKREIMFSIKFSKLTDVLWSGQKYLLLRDGRDPEWERYLKMTMDRIEMGNYYYS